VTERQFRISRFAEGQRQKQHQNQNLKTQRTQSSQRDTKESRMVLGTASDEKETFEFTITPFVSGGFLLDIRYSGDGLHNVTGAGVWPTAEKAKQIAEQSARRLLNGASVKWK
jgi:hypothetical protein